MHDACRRRLVDRHVPRSDGRVGCPACACAACAILACAFSAYACAAYEVCDDEAAAAAA